MGIAEDISIIITKENLAAGVDLIMTGMRKLNECGNIYSGNKAIAGTLADLILQPNKDNVFSIDQYWTQCSRVLMECLILYFTKEDNDVGKSPFKQLTDFLFLAEEQPEELKKLQSVPEMYPYVGVFYIPMPQVQNQMISDLCTYMTRFI